MSNPGAASTQTTVYGLGAGAPVQIGNSTTSLIAFYGVTPGVSQAGAVPSVSTQAVTQGGTPYGFSNPGQGQQLISSVNSIITALHNIGITA